MRVVCVASLSLITAGAAAAATIEVQHPGDRPPLVLITGEFEFSDVGAFSAAVSPLTKATVAFASDGGALVAGIRIGTLIREKRFATLVPDGATCASACAVAWLGGEKRFVGRGANVGFHAAYVLKPGGAVAESAPGNAVLGAYLDRLGLSEEAIRYVTDAEPSTIHWMSMIEAAEHGIVVAQWNAAEHSTGATEASKRVRNNHLESGPTKHRTRNDSLKEAQQSVRALFSKLSKLNPLPRVRAASRPEVPITR
ncbi:MAG TPA: hypothetical protein VH684_17555 [Xanthobacteraceae bacterium]